ncbi:hypothetical protein MSAN_01321800 [Mycena sanguinolenta]|uniref:Uncharacterized protein n=1 Tax=Mycena sanguinolenta TaxID=230812 RepID=A0A8H7D345_9AGAR|nr:hypothetical protein MSAN_01321800 [Mycena sanguinolenta]
MASSASIMQRARARAAKEQQSQASTPAPGTSRSSSPPPMDGIDSPNPFALSMPPRRVAQNTSAEMIIMKSAGERALKSRKLNDNSQADYRRFLETPHPLEREAIHHLAVLEVRELLQDNIEQRQQNWQPSKDLSKIIKKNIRALLVMPNVQYYGGSLAQTIIDAMRKSGTPGLPEDDSDIRDYLGHLLSVDKNTIKTTMKDERNIAHATAKILSSFSLSQSVQPTLSLYYRFALIRTELKKNHTNDVFWTEVDKVLDEYNKDGSTHFVLCMKENFSDDVDEYGDPAKTDIKLFTEPLTNKAPKWLKHIHDLAPKVRRLDGVKSRKWRRTEVDEEEDEPVDGDGSGEEPGNGDGDGDGNSNGNGDGNGDENGDGE